MNAPASAAKPPFTVRGWHVAAGVVAFFALVVGVDAGFLVMAYRSHPGQVAARPYEAGLVYNAELERLRAQEALGWRAGAAARAEGLEVVVQDRDRRPLGGLRVSATLQRPATEQGRTELALQETAPGRYAATRGLSGTWDVHIEAADGAGQRFMAERRLTWP
ncbi:FixH family protein [Brevundimonas sp.]|uniref:FixH family protein n=1 Tax=Brevundimonas sp. TaxID=1871086 RepID=UPI002D258294|nr:FixH family protein [Brevundimonas sp.]HYD27038.1 FixH family protein [Brevundimonas sp.]